MDPTAEGQNWDYKFDALRIVFAVYFSFSFLLQSEVVFEVTNLTRIFRNYLWAALIILVVAIMIYP
jgi:steroid 5-alpha reductase family enzyme